MKTKMEYRIGGRVVNAREWEKHLEEEPLRLARKDIERKLRGLRCPAHGQSPKPTFKRTAAGLEVSIAPPCCDELGDSIRRVLG
jgi:hypothetical protein